MIQFAEIEKKIGYEFKDKNIIRQALTHSSFSNEQKINQWGNYERVEFLGDAVLELVSSDYFYHTYPKETEGNLTKMRASAVCEQALAITARQLDLGNYIAFGKGEKQNGGNRRESIIADVVEAIIGALYLDAGMEEAKRFIHTFVLNDLENKRLFYDAKSVLQERVQTKKLGTLSYDLIKEEGPEHAKLYEVVAKLDETVIGHGQGSSKKSAQQQAAYDALLHHETVKK